MKKQHVFALTGLFVAGLLTSGAAAQIIPVGAFTGDESDGFEASFSGFQSCVPDRVFNSTADLCTQDGGDGLLSASSWGFICQMNPRSGGRFVGSATTYVRYTFDTPASAFGGYFGSNAYETNETPGGDANFFDAAGDLIGSARIDMGHCDWTWNGWESTGAPIASVELINDKFGAFLHMDDMEVNYGPAADCITLAVDVLVAGQSADWNVSGATPGEQVAVVFGFGPGSTGVNGLAGYCATFGIQGVNQSRVVCRKTADGAGDVTCTKKIPDGVRGRRVLSQAAERNTCPDECVSNLDDQTVQ